MSSAELLYGCALTLPGELISMPASSQLAVLDHLRRAAPSSVPTQPLTYTEAVSHPLQQLQSSNYPFVRKKELNVPALSPLYAGP